MATDISLWTHHLLSFDVVFDFNILQRGCQGESWLNLVALDVHKQISSFTTLVRELDQLIERFAIHGPAYI